MYKFRILIVVIFVTSLASCEPEPLEESAPSLIDSEEIISGTGDQDDEVESREED